jgi:hypothetical protein
VRPEDVAAYGVRVERAGASDAFVDVEGAGGRVVVHAADGTRAIVLAAGALGVPRDAPVTWDKPHPGVGVRWE